MADASDFSQDLVGYMFCLNFCVHAEGKLCGGAFKQASIFVQSHVQAHADLTWLLSCVTPISWLNKMIQFKEKARKAVGSQLLLHLITLPQV